MKVVIIEDEPHARQELKRLLAIAHKDVEVVVELESVAEAIEWLSENKNFDLLFLDIQLSDGLSFDIFNEIEMSSVVLEDEDLFQHSVLSEEIEFAHWFGLQGEIYLNDNKKPCLNLAHTVDIKPLKLKDRILIAWNILTNRNFKFDKVSMDWD
jgi:hypothetical protein